MTFKKLLFFIWLLLPGITGAQEYSFRSYSVREGLSQSQVYSLLQDHRGFLWAGTRGGGLSRFNGKDFVNFSSRDGLSSNYISTLLQSTDKNIWIGTDAGLNYYNGVKFKNIPELNGISVNSLAEDKRGRVWVGTENGLFFLLLSDGKTILQKFDSSTVYTLCTENSGGIWCGSDEGITRINTADIPESELVLKDEAIYNSLLEDSKGQLWMGSFNHGIQVLGDSGTFVPNGLDPNKVVLSICESEEGMWLGTLKSGLIHWTNDRAEQIDDRRGLANNQVRTIIKDSWGNIWVGTSGGGIARYYGTKIVHLNKDSGLPGRQVYAISEAPNGEIWLGVSDKGLVHYDRTSGEITADSLIENIKVKSIFRDSRMRMWVGTEGNGIRLYENDSSIVISGDDGLGGAWIKDINEDKLGNIWVATAGGGITRLSTDKSGRFRFKVFNRFSGLKDDRINSICPDSLNRIWFGSESGGLGVILPDETVLSFESEIPKSGRNIRSLAIDAGNWLWIGSGDAGLSTIDLNAEALTVSSLPSELQPPLRNVYLICPDNLGQLWVGTNDGAYRYTHLENQIEYRHFGAEEGFLGAESCTNACYLDESNQLWIGTVDGVNCVRPAGDPDHGGAPMASIEDITLYYKSLRNTDLSYFIGDWGVPRDTLVFTYDQNHIGFSLNAVRLSEPDQVYYQWWMQGLDSTWTPLLKLNTATFSNLNPGEYTFRYRTCNDSGDCEEGQSTVIRILQPFWQKSIYRWMAGIALLLLITLLFLWRLRIVKKRSREKTDRLRLQNKVLELEQQALRLQMNPHFIFNTLNSIQGLISLKDTKEARTQLSRFARLMRKTLENSSEELIPLSEELESCISYAELEKNARNLDFDLKVENKVEHDAWIPPLVLQPFVENAILHGIQGVDHKGCIEIICEEDGTSLKILIKDNGKGRSESSAEPKSHKSLGMKVTKERIEQDGKGGTLEIEDLFTEDGEQCGTAIHICIFEAINT